MFIYIRERERDEIFVAGSMVRQERKKKNEKKTALLPTASAQAVKRREPVSGAD